MDTDLHEVFGVSTSVHFDENAPVEIVDNVGMECRSSILKDVVIPLGCIIGVQF